MDILFTNATILPMTAAGDEPKTFMGAVGVAGNRIALVTASGSEADAFRTCNPGVRVIDCTGRLLMPGLVNTHCHAAMTLQRSYADDIALMEWLNDYIWPFEARQTADDVALGMTLGIVEMLLGGVTSFVDMYYHENRCVEVARRLGIRAMLGCNYFDNNVDEVLPEAEKAVALAADCDRIQIALAPHSPYTVSPENLRRGKELARKWGLHFMTHIAETQDEVRIVREKYAATPVEHLDALGMLDDKTIGAHCIHVTDSDIRTLARRGVAVSHNPQSNMKISSGVAPVGGAVESVADLGAQVAERDAGFGAVYGRMGIESHVLPRSGLRRQFPFECEVAVVVSERPEFRGGAGSGEKNSHGVVVFPVSGECAFSDGDAGAGFGVVGDIGAEFYERVAGVCRIVRLVVTAAARGQCGRSEDCQSFIGVFHSCAVFYSLSK